MKIFNYLKRIALGDTPGARAIKAELDCARFDIRRASLEQSILWSKESGVTDKRYCRNDIIVSLTSYGDRLMEVPYAIESIMQQTCRPNRIVLWLSHDDYAKPLPEAIIRQMSRGLEVRPTDDIRSYKKLIPSLEAYPDAAVITIDDDIIYEYDIVERLIRAHISDPENVHACRVHRMEFGDNGKLKPYNAWSWCTEDITLPPVRNFLTGGGGTIYPSHPFKPEAFDRSVFMSICPTADDVWFNAMTRYSGRLIKSVKTRSPYLQDYIENPYAQSGGLTQINVKIDNGDGTANDRQIIAVFGKYGIFDLIKS